MSSIKRQASEPEHTSKRVKNWDDRSRYKDSQVEIENGIIQPQFYPPELSNERAHQYANGELEKPIETLENARIQTQSDRDQVKVKDIVVHWFKNDLRTRDNKGLHLASKLAKTNGAMLICLFIVSPQDWQAHLTAPVRVDFILRNLKVLQHDLDRLNIPLHMETVEKRRNIPNRIFELCSDWGANHIFCNAEYEVDELRREALLIKEGIIKGISVNVVHDTCVVEPSQLPRGAVYSPWHRKWCSYLNDHPHQLDEFPTPDQNPVEVRKKYRGVFERKIPEPPANKTLSEEQRERFRKMWPAGEHEAQDRLTRFLKEKIVKYHETRNLPGDHGTSMLSPHLSAGTLSARTCVKLARDAAPRKRITDDRKQGHSMWIGEVAWRDFYKQVLCHWPYICMNKPFKPEYSQIEWEYDQELFQRWCEGKTGFPIVDAAMRQAAHTGYMHNRCRMIVASFLAKDLLIDWRMGEKWFMEHLVDGDFASNNGGWGFSASCGVDPQPYFRIFNPLLQSEKFDADGTYIRQWVPELKDIKSKAIHDPYGRGAGTIARKNGYPEPMVDHKASRELALARYKVGIGRNTA